MSFHIPPPPILKRIISFKCFICGLDLKMLTSFILYESSCIHITILIARFSYIFFFKYILFITKLYEAVITTRMHTVTRILLYLIDAMHL